VIQGKGKKKNDTGNAVLDDTAVLFENKFLAIFDPNGQETLAQSYHHVARGGRLVIYGFHTNLPKIGLSISPMQWLKMGMQLLTTMPRFDPMDLTLTAKNVMGFNLSFFSDEKELALGYFDTLVHLIEIEVIGAQNLKVTEMPMCEIRRAHELISSGTSVGKLVLQIP